MTNRGHNEDSDGNYIEALACAGVMFLYAGCRDYDLSMRVLGGIFMAPAVVKYSASVAGGVFDMVNGFCRRERLNKIRKSRAYNQRMNP